MEVLKHHWESAEAIIITSEIIDPLVVGSGRSLMTFAVMAVRATPSDGNEMDTYADDLAEL